MWILRAGFIALAIAAVGGCGVQGHWTLAKVQPAIGNEGFTIARASFYPNDSFEALAVRDGQTIKAKGTYDYCWCREELVLNMGDETRVYKASRKSCTRLEITETTPEGEKITAVMKQVEYADRNADCRRKASCCCP
ncbi:MAG TPA: hypothetical protein PL151_09030 [Phycisphaerae bacterium]|nr:hypothetical protein [Phycisphaerae bacterium]HOM53654.1 hypothetical protein [Phycisphaerae bacterium]HPP29013.1 hypothetical protein [Phycisphaerae bacterium]HPU27814.1 hypothetical protein [Phycisphaerae bacterium]HPZ97316.1 hypothetical protein [Phycisphaerae bacterium]